MKKTDQNVIWMIVHLCVTVKVKMKLLNVSQKILNKCGAVSEETAIDMAIGVQEKFSTNIGISTTGIAGPTGGTITKPIGLVFIGLAYNGYSKAYKFNFRLDRISNKMITVQAALNILRKNVKKYKKTSKIVNFFEFVIVPFDHQKSSMGTQK